MPPIIKPKDKKAAFLSVRITDGLKKKVEKIAKRDERTVSFVIGKIIERYMKGYQGERF